MLLVSVDSENLLKRLSRLERLYFTQKTYFSTVVAIGIGFHNVACTGEAQTSVATRMEDSIWNVIIAYVAFVLSGFSALRNLLVVHFDQFFESLLLLQVDLFLILGRGLRVYSSRRRVYKQLEMA